VSVLHTDIYNVLLFEGGSNHVMQISNNQQITAPEVYSRYEILKTRVVAYY
jgi:hypothetical protein